MWNDFAGKAVLITGGTRGIGLQTGLAFGRLGADVTLTHKWGSIEDEDIFQMFEAAGACKPSILQADAVHSGDMEDVLQHIREQHDRLDVFVSNAAFGSTVTDVSEYSLKRLISGIEYSAWPFANYTIAARRIFGSAPRYNIGVSSQGHESMHVGYDMIGASKSVLETLCRYMHYRLREEGSIVNVVRTRFVRTISLSDVAGEQFVPFVEKYTPDSLTRPEAVAEAILGMCSGLMDGLGGQVLDVDGGASLFDNFSRLFEERQRYPVKPKEVL